MLSSSTQDCMRGDVPLFLFVLLLLVVASFSLSDTTVYAWMYIGVCVCERCLLRIKCLYDLVCESDSFRSPPSDFHRGRGGAGGQGGSRSSNTEAKNVFPYVDEKAALVRDLPLSEILYSRHTHRLQSRRHPFWVDMKYKKNRTKIPYIYR